MGRIPEEIIQQIRERADIVDIVGSFVPLKKRSGVYWACCPFHKEKTPSFKLNQELQGYYCFGCKAHGNVIDFVKQMVNTDFVGAVRWLADRLSIEIPESSWESSNPGEAARLRKTFERRQNLLASIASWYHTLLKHPQAVNARNYLAGRGLDEASINHFMLGYSLDTWDATIKWGAALGFTKEDLMATGLITKPEDKLRYYDRFRGRLMFPIWNERGKVVGFSARVLDPEAKAAKYVNSPETDFFRKGELLYALNFARAAFKEVGYVLICEGQLDVIACHRAGLVNAVAAQGTAFTEHHARLLHKSVTNAVLSFDADGAGAKAAERTIAILFAAGFAVSVVTLPEGEDPDSIFRKGGADALRSVLAATEPAVPYMFRIACQDTSPDSPEGKSLVVKRVLTAVKTIGDEVARTAHCQWLAEKLGLPERVVLNVLASLPAPGEVRRSYAPPVYVRPRPTSPTAPHPEDPVLTMLLDLLLHFEHLARDFSTQQDVIAFLPDTPLGQALSNVVVFTEQDEWNIAIDEITKMKDIYSDPSVGKAILASDYASFDPKPEGALNRPNRAFQDCLTRLRLHNIANTVQDGYARLARESNLDKKREIEKEIDALVRRKQTLKRSLNTPIDNG